MPLMTDKTALIFGVANDHSLGWGVAQALAGAGARVGLVHGPRSGERRLRPLADKIQAPLVMGCDANDNAQIAAVMARASEVFGQIDVLVHSIAHADRDSLLHPYVHTSRQAFLDTLEISCYSFTALVQAALPLLSDSASIITMSADAAQRVVPGYNVMALAKAALETSVRYLANDLGPRGVRVNAISAGPIRTLAAAGIPSFKPMYNRVKEVAPLRRQITIEDVGNTALWLASPMAANITGQIIQVDAGYSIIGAITPPTDD